MPGTRVAYNTLDIIDSDSVEGKHEALVQLSGLEVTDLGNESADAEERRNLFFNINWAPLFSDLGKSGTASDAIPSKTGEAVALFAHEVPDASILHLTSSKDAVAAVLSKNIDRGYAAQLREHVLNPIGMKSSTLELKDAARAEHASPHGLDPHLVARGLARLGPAVQGDGVGQVAQGIALRLAQVDPEGAEDSLRQAEKARLPGERFLDGWVSLPRIWIPAARGEVSNAAAEAVRVADELGAMGWLLLAQGVVVLVLANEFALPVTATFMTGTRTSARSSTRQIALLLLPCIIRTRTSI
jgi:hypothetical protein